MIDASLALARLWLTTKLIRLGRRIVNVAVWISPEVAEPPAIHTNRQAVLRGLRMAIASAANDDRTEPGTKAHRRHTSRILAMWDAVTLLRADDRQMQEPSR